MNRESIPIYALLGFFLLFIYFLFFTDYLPLDNLVGQMNRMNNPFEVQRSEKKQIPDFSEYETSTIEFYGEPVREMDDITVNPKTNVIYATNGTSISIINGSNDQIIDNLKIPSSDFGYSLASNPVTDKLYALSSSGQLYIIEENESIHKIELNQTDVHGAKVIANSKDNKVYVLLVNNTNDIGYVITIDGRNDRIIDKIDKIGDLQAIAVNPNTNKVYAADDSDKSLVILDGNSNKLISRIRFGNLSPTEIIVNTNTNVVYCSFSPAERIILVDGSSDKLINTIVSSNSTTKETAELGVDPRYNVLYSLTIGELAILNDQGLVNIIRTGLYGSIINNTLYQPMTVNPNTNKVYAAGLDKVYVIKFGTKSEPRFHNQDVGIKVNDSPELLDANSQAAYVYSTGSDLLGNSSLSVIDLADRNVLQSKTLLSKDFWIDAQFKTHPFKNLIYLYEWDTIPVISSTTGKHIEYINGTERYSMNYFQFPYLPMTISRSLEKLYVSSNQGESNITQIDINNNTVVGKINLSQEYGLTADAMSPDVLDNKYGIEEEDRLYFLDRPDTKYDNSVLAELSITYNGTQSYPNITKKIAMNSIPGAMTVNPNTMIAYVTNPFNNSVVVIDLYTERVIDNIGVGKYPWDIQVNPVTNLVYVSNRGNNTVSVLDGLDYDTRLVTHITVGEEPQDLSVDPLGNIIYVANSKSDTVSLINGSTNKPIVAQGVKFDIEPPNSGHITCNGRETSINNHLLIDFGSICKAVPNTGYIYNSWIENFENYPSRTIMTGMRSEAKGPNLLGLPLINNNGTTNPESFNITRSGNFTATFKSFQPLISEETLIQTYAVIIGAILSAWLMPYLLEKLKLRRQHATFVVFEIKISKVFKEILASSNYDTSLFEALRKRINEMSVKGKISEMQHQILEKKISTCYHYILMKKLEIAKGSTVKIEGGSKVLDEIKDYITKEYVDGILNDLQYDRLTSKISEYESS